MKIGTKSVVYISGPMTDVREFNRPAFNEMEKLIKELFPDVVVLNPARHPDGLKYETYMEYAMIDVEKSNCLIMLDGWHNSPGAQRERAHAVNLGKNIVRQNDLNHFACNETEHSESQHNFLKITGDE